MIYNYAENENIFIDILLKVIKNTEKIKYQ